MAIPCPSPKLRFFNAAGNPLAGGKLYSYQANSATPQATYTDSGEGTANANPVVLDAEGYAAVWLKDGWSYKLVLKDASDVLQWSADNVPGALAATSLTVQTLTVANAINGNLVGNVTGNVTGNITGNSAGVHTGNVAGNVTGNVTGNVAGNLTAATATANTLNTKAPVANVKAFGAVGDGVADDSVAINAAIASGAKDIYLPAGTYKCNSPIDLAEKTGLTFRGDGENQDYPCTSILGNTGSVVLDLVGSSNCKLRGFQIRVASAYSAPSKVAILQGRSGGAAQFQYSQFNKYEGVMVYMDSIPAATIRGTVGIYNVGAEHTDYEDVYVIADQPLAMAATDVLSVPSPNAGAHGGPTSMTLCHFKNCGFRAWTNYGCEFWAAENITFDNCYSSRQVGSTALYPLTFNADCHQIKWRGQLEEWPAVATFNGNANGMELDLFSVAPTQTLIAFGAALTLSGAIIRIRQNGTARNLLQAPASSVLRGCVVHLATTAGITDANLTITGGVIIADDSTSGAVAVNPASKFQLLKDDGTVSFCGGAARWIHGSASEEITIAAAANTDSTANLLPANSIIEAVTARVTVVIPTAATFTIGDTTTAARFATGVAVAANTTAVGLTHSDQTGAAGPKQTAAAKVRITPNLSPAGATGKVRITVFYRTFVAPAS
jgi:hypothetical protein